MKKMIITGCQAGFQKINFTKLLQAKLGMALAEAHSVTNAIIELNPGGRDEPVEVTIPDFVDAATLEDLLVQAKALGAISHISAG
ncbi:MAG: hypothetical protein V4671_05980 [Armatimonadota bacterium]